MTVADSHFYGGLVDNQALGMLLNLLQNNSRGNNLTTNDPIYTLSRSALTSLNQPDPRRDIDVECGYPKVLTPELLYYNYRRNEIANRVVTVFSKESWQVQPLVYESENVEESTPFEQRYQSLGSDLSIEPDWCCEEQGSLINAFLQRVDEESGICHYGVLMLGIDDGKPLNEAAEGIGELNSVPKGVSYNAETGVYEFEPVPTEGNLQPYKITNNLYQIDGEKGLKLKSEKYRKLNYLRCFNGMSAEIVSYEANVTSPRFGQPTMYRLIFNDRRNSQTATGNQQPEKAMLVHWTRVLHVGDTGEVFSPPRQEVVYDRIYDMQKTTGAAGEGYWRSCFTGIAAETNPQLAGDVDIDVDEARNQLEEYYAGLQRQLIGVGLSFKTLAPQVVDPTAHFNMYIEAICICLGVPKRIFMGSERGELASSQDAKAWDERVNLRRKNYITPRIIRPFVNRLIWLGVLPPPEMKPMSGKADNETTSQDRGGFHVFWPTVDSRSDSEKAEITLKRTQSLVAYATSNAKDVMSPIDFLTREMGYSEQEAQEIINNAEEYLKEYDGLLPGQPEPDPAMMGLPSAGGSNGNFKRFDKNGTPVLADPSKPGKENGKRKTPDVKEETRVR